jgi:hypothetical protein
MDRRETESAIARDLDLCDLIEGVGTNAAKRKARAHRKACLAQVKAWNAEDGLVAMSDAELLAELGA